MRTLIPIVVLFKVQISLAFWEGNPTQGCLNGKGCMSDSQCGENGKCHFPEMTLSGKPSIGSCLCKGTDVTEDYDTYEQSDEDYNLESDEDYDLESDEDYDLEYDEDSNEKPTNDDLMNLGLKMNLPNLPSLLTLFQGEKMSKKRCLRRPCRSSRNCCKNYYCRRRGCKKGNKIYSCCYRKKNIKCQEGRRCTSNYTCGRGGSCIGRKCSCCKKDKTCFAADDCGGIGKCCSTSGRGPVNSIIGLLSNATESRSSMYCCCDRGCMNAASNCW